MPAYVLGRHSCLWIVLAVFGKIFQIMNLSVDNPETIMLHSVCNGKELRLQSKIISADLGESGFIKRDKGRLAFHQKKRERVAGQDYNIGAFGKGIVLQSGFHGEKRFWIPVVCDQQMNKMLPDPFLRRKRNEFPAYDIENRWFPVNLLNFVSKGGKI
jgi:hypothetical protein